MEDETMERAPAQEACDPAALEARLAAAEAENRLYRMAGTLGVSMAAVPYLARLCPAEGDEDAVRAALEKVLEDLPGLRQAARPAGGIRLGAGVAGAPGGDDELLRAAFGIR